MKKKVLFVCVHNSARSQIAEELMNKHGGELFEAESCGFAPTAINPLIVELMKEEGIDLSGKETKSVFNLFSRKNFYSYIITVCKRAEEKECPVFPGMVYRYHWDLENPEDYEGSHDEKMTQLRDLKDRIEKRVLDFIEEHK
jgi:arsenate reductase